ncbi:uncharacterized protein LOC112568241 [Pomacea canaliculata]|uniref:uncharacterized protein LOC112568241 n=1 Tax=Pomacea canaliculata TaxID=400727 RepID=UPI000D738A6C|nr:uncharacterized protein LOC112568241 [Pomacea canaliculata]
MLDGKPLQSQGSQITQANKVFVYSLQLSLPVTANLNGKIITCQSLLNPKKKEMFQQTIHVIKLVEKPVLTGPSKVIAGLRYSWYCVADGANRAVPTIKWFFGNGTNISHGYDSEDNSYNDKDELLTYNTSSKLTLIPSEADSTFSLYCQVKETDAEPGKVSKTVNIQVITCLKGKTFVEEGVDASKYDHIVTNGFYEFELSDLEQKSLTMRRPEQSLSRCFVGVAVQARMWSCGRHQTMPGRPGGL